ncbi:MAG: CDP-diacylglycerol--serine O-phosphatidyltransferase [Treponema sp.]|jgi:CDP-diacylglycerol--serine O-phosphatidyltransferase|nr:CDP-diacylglycerol--serine O-phosphatidyltransferase [Treponema sp.]
MKIRRVRFRKPQKRINIKRVHIRGLTREELKKGIYIIPSLFTCGNMSFGILSIIMSINDHVNDHLVIAAWFLIGALFCDILDGRIARMTKTTSMFGMELDSMSDLVSFGIAPAMMMYMLVLHTMGNIGIAIAVLYVLCCALRLARFNVLAHTGEVHKHFVGLPTPASAGVIISFVFCNQLLAPEGVSLNSKTIPVLMEFLPTFFKAMPVVIVALSFLMVSNIPYVSFKKLKWTKIRTIELMAVLIVLIILIVIFPQNVIFIIFTGYAVSGLLIYIPRVIFRKRKSPEKQVEVDEL